MLSKGSPLVSSIEAQKACNEMTSIEQPVDGDTFQIGTETYTTVTILAAINDVLIGVDLLTTLTNIVAAVNGSAGSGTSYGAGTVLNPEMTAELQSSGIKFYAVTAGYSGNFITTTENMTGSTFYNSRPTGGNDKGPQCLSFPRCGIYSDRGVALRAMPVSLLNATAEYAVRAITSALAPDPLSDESGQILLEKTEKVGPITEQKKYQFSESLSAAIKPYPAADKWLSGLVCLPSRVIRG